MRAIGFPTSDIDSVILAREVLKKDMVRLLEKKWGMGMLLGFVH